MNALAGLLHLLAVVLVISGIQKLIDPEPATTAMADAGLTRLLPDPLGHGARASGLVLGAAEIGTGLAALSSPSAMAVAWLGCVYAGFAGFVVLLRARDATAGCGCFGASSAPPTLVHLALNIGGALVAVAVIGTGVPDIVDVVDEGLGVLTAYVVLVATGAGLVLLGPVLLADVERASGRSTDAALDRVPTL